ncbi:Glucan endo-1,3-alpha-glucosidase agn1 [Savitreella phatthalungensis]
MLFASLLALASMAYAAPAAVGVEILPKRAVTVYQTQTVAYTVMAPVAFATAYPNTGTTLTTSSTKSTAPTTAPMTTKTSSTAAATTTAQVNTGSSTGAKKVFAHYMLGNSYPMGVADFQGEIARAQAAGIDGFALNVGPDSWMADRASKMYQAAIGTSFKLFISLDMAVMASSAIQDLTHWVTDYSSHPNQYFYNSKQFVSTFAGESVTFGQASATAGWALFKSTLAAKGVNIFFVPSFTALGPTNAMGMSSNDGAFSWDAWPTGNSAMSTAEDQGYMAARNGKVYMAGVSPWFFTHFSYKNWIYKSDDLYTTRWEQLVQMQPDFVEIITWNDYGESSYIGPITGATPYDSTINSAQWVNGHDHTAWLDLTAYYIQAYKQGALFTPSSNKLFMWYRTQSKNAAASADPYGQPTNSNFASDNIYLTVLLTSPATVTVSQGGQTQTFAGQAGVNKFQFVGFTAGAAPSVTVTRNGATILSQSGPRSIDSNPTLYNYNPVVASWSF